MVLNNSWPPDRPSTVDCFIVGGAAVGLSLACLLAKTGRHVAVIDAAPQLPGYGRKIALSLASVNILSRIDVWAALAPKVFPMYSVEVTIADHLSRLLLTDPDTPGDAVGYVCPLEHLHEALLAQAATYPTLHYAAGVALESLTPCPDGWQLTLSDGTTCKTGLLVGADGTHSAVRQQMGIGLHVHDYDQVGLISKIRFSHPIKGRAFERFIDNSALAILPLGEYEAALVWSMPTAQGQVRANLPEKAFAAAVQQAFGYRLGSVESLTPPLCVPFRFSEAYAQIARRCVLVGNAAHTLHPIAAQGFNLSLRDVATLADHLERAQVPTGACLSGYVQARTADQQQVITATDMLARYVATDRFPAAFKALGLFTFAMTPGLKQAVARMGMEGLHADG